MKIIRRRDCISYSPLTKTSNTKDKIHHKHIAQKFYSRPTHHVKQTNLSGTLFIRVLVKSTGLVSNICGPVNALLNMWPERDGGTFNGGLRETVTSKLTGILENSSDMVQVTIM